MAWRRPPFGLIAGALLGGPVATRLIEKYRLRSTESAGTAGADPSAAATEEPGIAVVAAGLARHGRRLIVLLGILALCIKGGAWVGYALQQSGMIFPVSMGGMLVGLIVRNLHDALGFKWIDNDTVDGLGALLSLSRGHDGGSEPGGTAATACRCSSSSLRRSC